LSAVSKILDPSTDTMVFLEAVFLFLGMKVGRKEYRNYISVAIFQVLAGLFLNPAHICNESFPALLRLLR
jgi:hypothetical protein